MTYGRHLFQNYRPAPVAFERGRGARLWDTEGREYVDFLAGIATSSLGHAHPRLVSALRAQAERVLHVSNLFQIPEQDAAANLLVEAATEHLAAGSSEHRLERVFFCNSGAEANEAAIKLARKHAWRLAQEDPDQAERRRLVAIHSSFHGRTLGALSITGTPAYREGFDPVPGRVDFVPFNDLEALDAAITERTSAVLIEPVQGEGGVWPAEEEFLRSAQRWCRERGALFVLDEVQTGPGRCGITTFAFQRYGLSPDVVVLAKGLGAGVPVGAILATEEASLALQPGDHGSTFGGNPLATTAVRTVLEVLAEEGLAARAEQAGQRLASGLRALGESTGRIRAVRGLGLMLAAELNEPAAPVAAACLAEGVVVHAVRPTSIRFLPPLVITDDDIDQGLERFERALSRVDVEATTGASR